MPKPTLRRCARLAVAPLVVATVATAVLAAPAAAHPHPTTARATATATTRKPTRPTTKTTTSKATARASATGASGGSVSPALPTSGHLGIDVASHQHPDGKPIDWARVRRAGVRFAFIKADEGAHGRVGRYVNPWFSKDWAAAGQAGVARGAYHFARPRLPLSTATADADAFVRTVGRSMGELPPVLDLEESGGLTAAQIRQWATDWLRTVERRTGKKPMVYSARWFWNSYLAGSTAFSGYPFWVASYTSASSPGALPPSWSGWNFWQYSAKGRVPGISGDVDLNVGCSRGGYVGGYCPGSTTRTKSAARR